MDTKTDQQVVIVDYGMGNLHSVQKKLLRLHAQVSITADPEAIRNAGRLILPGVGHFGKAMENLQQLGLIDVLNEAVLTKKTPILGICLGMQLMTRRSEEGNVAGLGWLDAEVVHFKVQDSLKYKIPHMGWNQVSIAKESQLMKDIPANTEFYFVHSYHAQTSDRSIVLNETEYEYNFVSALEKDNIFGVQYHPEKSHDAGETLIKNFLMRC